MCARVKSSSATIPYQLRPHKAIERNLFIAVLKKLDRVRKINLEDYRYVGFGAPFLEDHKMLHTEFNITKMDCVEENAAVHSRQVFNNPLGFLELYCETSTAYISGADFKQDSRQIIWWDFAIPSLLRQSLLDIELTAEKTNAFDILKVTLNANITAFAETHQENEEKLMIKERVINYGEILRFLNADQTFQNYIPDGLTEEHLKADFAQVLRAMIIRAAKRGLSKSNHKMDFHHLCSFKYADGQVMTTLTGIVAESDSIESIISESGLKKWEFYHGSAPDDLVPAHFIQVPSMTVQERNVIDRKIHAHASASKLAESIEFKYGSEKDHLDLIEGYCKYYRFLPYYSKIIV